MVAFTLHRGHQDLLRYHLKILNVITGLRDFMAIWGFIIILLPKGAPRREKLRHTQHRQHSIRFSLGN